MKPKNKSWELHRKDEKIRTKKDREARQYKSLRNKKLIYYKRWDDDDKEYLIKSYKEKTMSELSKKLNRTYYSIQMMIKKLGINKQ